VKPGLSAERTSLAWWRTSQTAIAVALVLAKLSDGGPASGWVATACALLVAVAAWSMARRRAGDEASQRAPLRPDVLLAFTATCLVLGLAVLAFVVSGG